MNTSNSSPCAFQSDRTSLSPTAGESDATEIEVKTNEIEDDISVADDADQSPPLDNFSDAGTSPEPEELIEPLNITFEEVLNMGGSPKLNELKLSFGVERGGLVESCGQILMDITQYKFGEFNCSGQPGSPSPNFLICQVGDPNLQCEISLWMDAECTILIKRYLLESGNGNAICREFYGSMTFSLRPSEDVPEAAS